MKVCKGDKYCERKAEYKVMLNDKIIYLCGYCLIAKYTTSNGLKKEVLKVIRLQ